MKFKWSVFIGSTVGELAILAGILVAEARDTKAMGLVLLGLAMVLYWSAENIALELRGIVEEEKREGKHEEP